MWKTTHLRLDIKGFINNRKYPKGYEGVFDDENGHAMKPSDARNFLLDCLSEGKLFLPIGECEGFSYQHGCPGHPYDKPQQAE